MKGCLSKHGPPGDRGIAEKPISQGVMNYTDIPTVPTGLASSSHGDSVSLPQQSGEDPGHLINPKSFPGFIIFVYFLSLANFIYFLNLSMFLQDGMFQFRENSHSRVA